MRGLEASARDALSRRLLSASPRPIAVALSGGGDSLALTLIADAWARAKGRELLVLTIDHRLQADSVAWTAACAATAKRLGRPFRTLAWKDSKPATGLPAAARRARHALLADAAREAGARVILMGHTADDIWESRFMRDAGSTTPEPQIWAPSPAWPEGRGLFVLRPLLSRRRAEIRDWLRASGETWIDDPANDDPRYARSRARTHAPPVDTIERVERPPVDIAARVQHLNGAMRLHRPTLRRASEEDAARLISLACVCAGGGAKRPTTDRLVRAATRVQGEEAFTASLAGARIQAGRLEVSIAREAGEVRRGGLAPLALPAGHEVVWDGRFAVTASRPGLAIRAVSGTAAQLSRSERMLLRLLHAGERGGLPAIVDGQGRVESPLLGAPTADVALQSLVEDRFRAAAGLVDREPA